ncbi:hypothetical protein [Alienimonas californiensis]|uniref:Uncharacterized protein n=1 Tax=Alienimonas californiensis TaxID=2527989 RepID=A0A517P5J2_9PLAN|nr:hypothetical protein [Alienimonas californiensis]QDT14649.1 hypothetical protein CA12_07260 [Alienimonas californiensis]
MLSRPRRRSSLLLAALPAFLLPLSLVGCGVEDRGGEIRQTVTPEEAAAAQAELDASEK